MRLLGSAHTRRRVVYEPKRRTKAEGLGASETGIKIRLTSIVEKRRASAEDRTCRCKDHRSKLHVDRRERSSPDEDRHI